MKKIIIISLWSLMMQSWQYGQDLYAQLGNNGIWVFYAYAKLCNGTESPNMYFLNFNHKNL